MKDVAAHGRTVLFVSHNMAAVEALCSRAVRISEGAFVQDGQPQEIIRGYHGESTGVGLGEYRSNCTTDIIQAVVATTPFSASDNAIREGETLLFRISVRPDAIVDAFSITLGIDNGFNQRMLTLRCCPRHDFRDGWSSRELLTCEVPEIPLAAGRYSLAVVCHNGNETVDARPGVLEFDVQANPLFYTQGHHRRGLCVTKARWSGQVSPACRHTLKG